MHPIESKLKNINIFLEKTFNFLKDDNIDVSNYELDHICYRVETITRYNELKLFLSNFGSLLTETEIGGRLISTFKLTSPILFENRKIYCLELPSPKFGSRYKEGFEHIEFVISESFEKFMNKYSRINFNTRALSKSINKDISIKYIDCSIKFHHNTLEYVIKYEQN
jgi:predicted metalloenzyme YecM